MEIDQYCLRWDKYQPNIVSAVSNLLSSEALLDVTLAAEGKYLQAHKVILSACSPYFQTLFTANQCQHPIVILQDVQFADLKAILDFIYTGEARLVLEQIPNFFKIGELLKIKGVSEVAFASVLNDDDGIAQSQSIKPEDSNVPKPTTVLPSPITPSRRKGLRKSLSTGSEFGSPERMQCSRIIDQFDIKLEPVEFLSDSDDVSGDLDSSSDFFIDETTSIVATGLPEDKSQCHEPLPEHEPSATNSDSTLVELPGPSTSLQEPPLEEQIPLTDELLASNSEKYYSLTERSRLLYDKVYNRFKEWCRLNDRGNNSLESLLISYFSERSNLYQYGTFNSEYAMLKTALAVKDKTDIQYFFKLNAFLNEGPIGFQYKSPKTNKNPKTIKKVLNTKVFTRNQFCRFLTEAPNKRYLLMKVVAIIGIVGECRIIDLQNMTVQHVEDIGSALVIKIPKTKYTKERSFVINDTDDDSIMVDIYRKYASLRHRRTKHNQLFISYRNGKCSSEVVEGKVFRKIPSEIARYLGLPNPCHYTGHCFRNSSAALIDKGFEVSYQS